MRLLFCTTPLDGHFRPLLPLARSLAARGHDVAFATAASWHAHVEAEGFEALAAGADHAAARGVRLTRAGTRSRSCRRSTGGRTSSRTSSRKGMRR